MRCAQPLHIKFLEGGGISGNNSFMFVFRFLDVNNDVVLYFDGFVVDLMSLPSKQLLH